MDNKVIISPRAIQDLSYIVRYILFGDPKAVFTMPTLSLAKSDTELLLSMIERASRNITIKLDALARSVASEA